MSSSGEVEVGTDGVSAEDSEPFVVAISDAVSGKPVGNESFAIGLDESSVFGGDAFVEFHLGVEVAAIQKNLIEAGVAKSALESLLAAGVFLGGRLTAAPNAFVPSTSLLEADSIADGLSRRMSSPPHVVFR